MQLLSLLYLCSLMLMAPYKRADNQTLAITSQLCLLACFMLATMMKAHSVLYTSIAVLQSLYLSTMHHARYTDEGTLSNLTIITGIPYFLLTCFVITAKDEAYFTTTW